MTEFTLIKSLKNNKLLTVFSFVFVSLFICLGIWQIDRASEKSHRMQAFAEQQQKFPMQLTNLSLEWSRAFVDGAYDPMRQILIDNQIHNGKIGYKIYTPFYFENSQIILVDRGWIPQGKSRNDLPDLNFSSSNLRIIGTLVKPQRGVVAGEELITNSWPRVSQTKSTKIISSAFTEKISEMVLVLDPGSKFINEYIPITPFVITPVKHYSYAMQWFTMSIVLFGMFLYALKREKYEK